MQKTIHSIVLIFLIGILLGCASQENLEEPSHTEVNNRYDSEFPNRSISSQLDFVSTTIKKLDVLAFYKTYIFDRNNTLDEGPITKDKIKKQSLSSSVNNESVTGTATVVYYDGNKVGLLTCAHVVNFPDTIIMRFDDGKGPIEVLSIKVRQQNYAKGLPEGDELKIIATDKKNDIAFLIKELDKHEVLPQVLDYPAGNSKDLEWGSIVYIMGFPVGNMMVTRAIVSNPDNSSKNRFLTDALYNRGISGSPVLAIRDGVPNLEMVGMATSSAANKLFYTKPGKKDPDMINPNEPYTGELYIEHVQHIKYGVTFNVTIEAINNFFRSNRKTLLDHGVDAELLFK